MYRLHRTGRGLGRVRRVRRLMYRLHRTGRGLGRVRHVHRLLYRLHRTGRGLGRVRHVRRLMYRLHRTGRGLGRVRHVHRLLYRLHRTGRRLLAIDDGDDGATRDGEVDVAIWADPLAGDEVDRRFHGTIVVPRRLGRGVLEDDQPRGRTPGRVVHHAESRLAEEGGRHGPHPALGRVDQDFVQSPGDAADASEMNADVAALAAAVVAKLILHVPAAAHKARVATRAIVGEHGAPARGVRVIV